MFESLYFSLSLMISFSYLMWWRSDAKLQKRFCWSSTFRGDCGTVKAAMCVFKLFYFGSVSVDTEEIKCPGRLHVIRLPALHLVFKDTKGPVYNKWHPIWQPWRCASHWLCTNSLLIILMFVQHKTSYSACILSSEMTKNYTHSTSRFLIVFPEPKTSATRDTMGS